MAAPQLRQASATRFHFNEDALATMRDCYARGMRGCRHDLFPECLARVEMAMGGIGCKAKLLQWIGNQRMIERRRRQSQATAAAASETLSSNGTKPIANTSAPVAVGTALAGLPGGSDGQQILHMQPNGQTQGSSDRSGASDGDVTRIERTLGSSTPSSTSKHSSGPVRRGAGKRTPWHLLLRDDASHPRGAAHQKDTGVVSPAAATAKEAMSHEEWANLEREAEEESKYLEFEDGREYTDVERQILLRHYLKIFNWSANIIGKLGVSMVGCRMPAEGQGTENFYTGPYGESALRLMEEQNIHMWQFLTTAAWGTAGVQPPSVDEPPN